MRTCSRSCRTRCRGDTDQILVSDFDQLVTRIGFEYVEQGLVAMAARQEAKILPYGGNLAPQQRHVGCRHMVDVRRVQADESTYTDNAAARRHNT
jgi:hypothetical protein